MTYKGKWVCSACWGASEYEHDSYCHCNLYIQRPKFLDATARLIVKNLGVESSRYDEPKTAAQIINRRLEDKLAEIFNSLSATPTR